MNSLQRNKAAFVTPQYGKGKLMIVLPYVTDPSQNIKFKKKITLQSGSHPEFC